MASFLPAYTKTVLGNEGPYDFDKDDPGGETVFGIDRRDHPTWPGFARLDDFKRQNPATTGEAIKRFVIGDPQMQELVKSYYLSGPWAGVRGDDIKSQEVAERLFDAAVNCGLVTVIKWHQRALNVFSLNGERFPVLDKDGYMGNKSVDNTNALMAKCAWGERVLIKALNAQQGERYLGLGENNPRLEKYEGGWWDDRISN